MVEEFVATWVRHFEVLARVRTEGDFPQYWATTQNNLGAAYSDLPIGNHSENLRSAIERYEGALRVWTEHDFPLNWAGAQSNLGNVYAILRTGDRGDNTRSAIEHHEAAARGYDAVRQRNEADRARATAQRLRKGLT